VDAGQNISLRQHKQLVLELEVGVGGTKVIERLPSSIAVQQATPLVQHVPGLEDGVRRGQEAERLG